MVKQENTKKSYTGWIVLGVVLVLIFISGSWWIGTSNGLNNAQQQYQSQWSQVQNVMQRRYDLIPNLTASVRGQMKHEDKVFKDIADARKAYSSANTPNEKMKADAKVNTSVGALINVIHERYPKLTSQQNVSDLMTELEGSENRISVERRRYIQDVQSYNQKVMNFPGSVVANSKGMHTIDYYKADDSAQKAPKVDLDY